MRKFFKVTLYIIGGIIALLLCVIVYLNTPWGQNFVRSKAEAYLNKKLKTEVHIGHLGYGLPKYIVLNDVLFRDQAKDTLLSVGTLKIDLAMLKLLHKEVDVQQLVLDHVHAHVYRNAPDTNYNFTYIINAFAGNKPKDTTKPKDPTSSLTIDLNRVKFDDIHIRFDDYTGGTRLALDLDQLELKMKKVDLDKMSFHVKDLSIAGLQTVFLQDTSYLPPKLKTDAKSKLLLVADNIHLQRINFKYNDNLNKLLFTLGLGDLNVALKDFDLEKSKVDLGKFELSNTDVVLQMGKHASAPAVIDTVVKKNTTEGWHVNAGELRLAGVNFKMDNDNAPRQKAGMDYSHLGIRGVAINAKDILFTGDTVAGNIQHLAVKEQSGFNLVELKTVFNYNPQGATLRNLYLQTDNTILQNHLEVHYPSLAALKTRMQSMQLRIDLQKSIVGIHDILIFAPQLAKQDLFRKNRNGRLRLAATLSGFLNNIDIKNFYLDGLSNTVVQVNGRLSGLPESKDINYNLHVAKLQSSRTDLSTLLPPSALSSVRLPDRFGIIGQIAGTIKDYNANLYMMSTDGEALIKGTLAMSPGKGKERYDMFVRTKNLDLGRILKKDTLMGKFTATITAKGQSFDIKTMTATITGDIAAASIKGYNYHDITLNGSVADKKGEVTLKAVDTNLQIHLNGNADFSGKYIAAKADIMVDSMDFRALKLYSSELRIHGDMHLDFPELDVDYPRGEFVWRSPIIDANGKRYLTDSLYIVSRPSADTGQNIVMDFDILQAHITGKTPLSKIPDIIQDHINRHYTAANDSTNKSMLLLKKKKVNDTSTIPSDYNLVLQAHVIDRPLLHGLLPAITSIDSIHIDASITPRNLIFNANIPDLEYGTTTSVQNGNVQVRGTDSAFTYKVTVDQITQSKFELWYANIHGNIDQNTLTTNISLSDSAKKERFALAASIKKDGDNQVIVMEPGLKLNYKKWTVAQPNSITIAPAGFYVQNFQLSDSNEYIKINSTEQQPNTPIKVDISNFVLANITDIISKGDTLLANGLLGGNITLNKMKPALDVNGDLQMQNLSVLGDTIGDLKVTLNDKGDNVLDTKLAITGHGNNISLNGAYYLQPQNGNDFDFTLGLDPLNVQSFEGIAMNQIRNTTGFIRGDLKIQGATSAPEITGSLHTDNLATTVTALNAYFKMPNEKIDFSNSGINFDNFTLQDSAGNKATINGSIATSDLSNLAMDLHIKANDWRALHSTAKDNKVFYGDLLLTTNMDISGTPTSPSVDGNLNILKGTNMTVVMPESDPQLESGKGIVKFVNMKDSSRDNILIPKKKRDSTKVRLAKGSNINVNVNVDKNAQFSLIIDQASGDFISIRGDASLNTAITPTGGLGLAGSYELHEGAYQLNYNFIKRKFAIKDGSTITFAGDPTKGTNVDITAVYTAQTAPYDLIQREISDNSQLNYYKQSLPFDVELHMKGPVLQPAITFNILLPENKVYPLSSDQIELIEGKLSQLRNDTSELNKQVFAVLILNRFISDDPFSNGAGTSVGNTALQSVSRFIGEQLNQAAGKLIKGVDLSVDLATTDDYTTGDMRERTDLNLAASKRLLNDRLKVTIGNDFELEGPQTSNSDQNSVIPSNLSADYLLTADGKYTTQAYRKNYNEGVLQGYVTETGLNFIVSLDFNHFKNAFRKKKKESSMVKSTPKTGASK